MVFLFLVFLWFLRSFSEGGEKSDSDLGNGLLVGKGHSVIQSLWAYNSVFLGVNDKAAKTRVLLVVGVPFWQEVCFVNCYFAGNVLFTLQWSDLLEHEGLIGFDWIVNQTFDDWKVGLSHLKDYLGLNKFDQTLNKQVLEQLGVSFGVSFKIGCHLLFSLKLEWLD